MTIDQQKMTDAIHTVRGSLEILFHYFQGQNPYNLTLDNEQLIQFTIAAGKSIMDLESLIVMESLAMPSVMVN
jgi:hypothetical protein